MKKITLGILFLILLIILSFNYFLHSSYKALLITDNCKIGIDINDNGKISENELFSLDDITTFCSPDNISYLENKIGKLSDNEKIHLSLKTKDLFNKIFLLSLIRFDNSNITANFSDVNLIFLNNGLALANNNRYKKYENFEALNKLREDAKSKNYVLLNTKSLKYHKIDCENGLNSKQKLYILFDELPAKAKPCKYCHKSIINSKNFNNPKSKSNKFIEKTFDTDNIKIFYTIAAGTLKPSSFCSTEMCKSLLKEINASRSSIDMAIYDFANQPELLAALRNAKNRGVKIRVAIDDKNYYKNSRIKDEINSFSSEIYDDSSNKKDSFRLMHNKFMIFDNKTVWTGTANLTDTCLSGFNSNITFIIRSNSISKFYEMEFENFVQGKFHSSKQKIPAFETNEKYRSITTFFSPKDKVISTQIIPEIKMAKHYIFIPAFIATHSDFANELIKAKKRGVDVRLIIDATSARNKYSIHSLLRNNNIPVKTENFAGKMHSKAVIIDDKVAFVGSMNLTKSGNVYNDENCLKIENKQVVLELKKYFLQVWALIPDKYLHFDPAPESFESVGSCFDGVDNDFDGLVDMADSGCKIIKPMKI